MNFLETVKMVEGLPYESRLGFIGFCVEQCLNEASRHPIASQQLKNLSLLKEGLAILWARAEHNQPPDLKRIAVILSHLDTYWVEDPRREDILYTYDFSLCQAALILKKGMYSLQNEEKATARYVAGSSEGPYMLFGAIYEDYRHAQEAWNTVRDTVLQRLVKWGNKPFSRIVFEGIPDWPRGRVTKKYTETRLPGSAETDDE